MEMTSFAPGEISWGGGGQLVPIERYEHKKLEFFRITRLELTVLSNAKSDLS